jgi:EAL domain-containing protein (putative c-di-GMP-specific phosphodiesterase class I)/CheY-like chemotaxis protein
LALLVDDDAGFAKACGHVLSVWGYDVQIALTGEEALQLLRNHFFDVLLCDIHIPNINGLDVLQAAREKDRDMPVILMTGTPGVETARKAVELGAQGYLIKPLPLPQLQEILERSVRQARIARAQRFLLDSNAHMIRENEALRQQYNAAIRDMWMAFQPIVSWSSKTVVAYEALLRTRAPILSQPAQVISAAEALGEMHNLGLQTRSIIAEIMGNHPNLPGVFVNLHVLDLLDEQLYQPESPLAPYAKRIHFEITERMAIEKVPDTHARINRLRMLGYKIAIDDLGEGYSGLNSLAELEPDAVKLDMSLIRGIDHVPTKRKMVQALARLCRDLGTHAVAEGVETTAECESLVDLGVDWLQGFLFAHPDFPFPIPRM